MTLRERFERVGADYLRFDRIPEAERLHPSRTLCGYLKVASLLKHPAEFEVSADHDVVYLTSKSDLQTLTDADILYLTRCGIHWDSEGDCLADFC